VLSPYVVPPAKSLSKTQIAVDQPYRSAGSRGSYEQLLKVLGKDRPREPEIRSTTP
jgi:hypothetical protein